MAIELYSNTGTEEDLKEAFTANGATVPGAATVDDKPKEEPKKETKPEQTVEPGAEDAAETAAETDPEKGPEDKTKQGHQEPKAKGGWQRKVEKQRAEIADLRKKLDEYAGVETSPKYKAMQEELAAAKAKLTELNPPTVTKDEGPVKPKRPTLAECDYDQDKLEAALEAYDDKMTQYHESIAERKTNELLTQREQAEQAKRMEEESNRVYNEFVTRKDKERDLIPDFDELIEASGKTGQSTIFDRIQDGSKFGKVTPAESYLVMKSKHPAELLAFFMKDLVENDGDENERFQALDPIDLIIELRELEGRLASDRAKAAKGSTSGKEETTPKEPEKPPVKPQRTIAKTPDAPLETVGGGSTNVVSGDLNARMAKAAAAGNSKEFRELLKLQQAQKHQLRS